ncbi:hypothetical protein [Arthrobacter sp. MA-N2]|uniref:hypothetical protein n=1 Tax=Arthrobacter sp. MA-N2 TaxID=1101188 RepID=UPI000488150A|nr:hypothetical protein [Arthrobacter sp. MA-N2]
MDESPGRLIQLGVDGTKLAQPLVDTDDFRVEGPMTPSELAAELITSRAGTTRMTMLLRGLLLHVERSSR